MTSDDLFFLLRFVKFLRRQTPRPGTQMDAALKYFKGRDDQARAARPGSAAATSSAVAGTSSDPGPSGVRPPPPCQPRRKG